MRTLHRTGLATSIALGAAGAILLAAPAAQAQEEWKEEGGEAPPPDDHPAKKPDKKQIEDAPPGDPSAAPARFLADLKIGPAFVLTASGVTEFSLQLNFGYALAQDLAMKGDAFYLTVSPYLLVGEDLALVAPLGAQYEMPLKMIPYEGISAYVRTSVGYAFYKPPLLGFDQGLHGFAVQPAIGAKLAFFKRFHVGIEPLGFDILTVFPPKSTNQSTATTSAFQLAIFAGAKF